MALYVERDLFGSIAIVDMNLDELKVIRKALKDKEDDISRRLIVAIDRFLNNR